MIAWLMRWCCPDKALRLDTPAQRKWLNFKTGWNQ